MNKFLLSVTVAMIVNTTDNTNDMVKPGLRKTRMPTIVVRQSMLRKLNDRVYMYFQDNVVVIVNPKGEMYCCAITGVIGKE
ncbi:60S ribosomal protein L23-like [Olea europaea var. sylvestris]|uniref:60S ribosomal protein L23-like n=1 Tax=Olea europaea var. sylvestris TaxID=158386 RepID=UPI000C1CFDD7|nr:60S ribosomal protein L23-like [Olea europaea var. sylvestris]